MRNGGRWLAAMAAAVTALLGCGGDETVPPKRATKQPPVIDILVDANRDGELDADDEEGKNEWTLDHGASYLANLDDDDSNGVRDADDEVINGDTDFDDLAYIVVAPWADAPRNTTGVFTLDDASAANARLWKQGADGAWVLVGGSLGPCDSPTAPCQTVPTIAFDTTEVRRGVTLAIEARAFKTSNDMGAWSGYTQLTYSLHDSKDQIITTDTRPDGFDYAVMRVAPWMLNGNLSPFDQVWSDGGSSVFVKGIQAATDEAGITYKTYKNYADQWTQDFFQTAWTAIPGKDGTLHGMRVANARPWSQSEGAENLPIAWLMKNYLGPDHAVVKFYFDEHIDTATSYDSHGNHDLIPPYVNGESNFPMGRIFIGSGVLAETKAVYDAQGPQSPHFSVDSSWLYVGHIDEMFSYVPAKTARGWKLLVGSPKLARTMLEKLSADGNGAVHMFVGKKRYDPSDKFVDAEVAIDDVLANVDLMQWSQEAQAEIDSDLADFQDEVGLADDEIVEIPYLFEEILGGKIAYQPGTANLLAFGDFVVHPDPFGPKIGGIDVFKKDLQDRLGTAKHALGADGQGLEVRFTDDWSLYHILDGEVHCGSNPEAPPPSDGMKWWETGR